jgi:hypothetical protein
LLGKDWRNSAASSAHRFDMPRSGYAQPISETEAWAQSKSDRMKSVGSHSMHHRATRFAEYIASSCSGLQAILFQLGGKRECPVVQRGESMQRAGRTRLGPAFC